MIITLKKYLFIGAKEELDQFFQRAQKQGFIEFISLKSKKHAPLPLEVQHLLSAMKILRKQPVKSPYVGGGTTAYACEIADRILMLNAEIDKISEEKRLIEAEIARVSPFGDFSKEDIAFIEQQGHRHVQFFCMKSSKRENLEDTDDLIYVGTDFDLDYFISISPEIKSYPHMIEMRIDRPVGDLKNHLSFLKETLHQLEAELKGYAGHITFLHDAMIELIDEFSLANVKKEASLPLEETLFAIEGWVPKNKIQQLFSLIDGMAVHCEPIAIEKEEKIPTYMENRGGARLGEDLVFLFDVPANNDKDPSGWVIWAFALFFAMIVADAGYGLLYLALAFFLKWKFPTIKSSGRRLLKLMTILAVSCVIWGVFTTAFFGIKIDPTTGIGRYSPLGFLVEKKAQYHFEKRDDVYQTWLHEFPSLSTAQSGREMLDKAVSIKKGSKQYEMYDSFSDSILLEISLLIGVIHICLSLLRYGLRNLANFGWVAFAIGGYLYFPIFLNATSLLHFLGIVSKQTAGVIGEQVLYSGIIAAVVLALIQKRLKGLAEITNVIQIFGDILSYLRLYALALASTIMARTFNGMGADIGLFLGMIVILAGHLVNISLGIVAGVIHGLRLNFLEWYHYSFFGGGKLFNPLRRLKSKL